MKDFIRPGDIYVATSVTEKIFNTSDAGRLFENATYKISRFTPGSLLISGHEGFSHKLDLANTPEGMKLVRRITDTDSVIGFDIMSLAYRTADITVTFFDPMMAAQNITAFVNGEEFDAVYDAREQFIRTTLDDIPLEEGMNYLHFKINGDTSMMSLAAFELRN
jgi:hypothetical protein